MGGVLSGELLCSFAELDALGEALRIDVRPFPFAFPFFGEAKEDRARLFESAHHSLRERGLIRGHEFAPELVELLHVFARGQVAVVLVGNSGDAEHVGLAASEDRTGVVVVQDGDAVRFVATPPDAVVRGLIGQLRPLRPEPAAAGGAAGARGAAGAGAMGGAGAGAGRGEGGEDAEHKSKYLKQTDEYFGDDRMVAPPVIGG